MQDDQKSTQISAEDARQGRKTGIWKVLIVSVALAIIALVIIGQFGG